MKEKEILARKVSTKGELSNQGKIFTSLSDAARFLQTHTITETETPRSLVTRIGQNARAHTGDVFGYRFQYL